MRVRDGVVMAVGWGCEVKGKDGDAKNIHRIRYTFIISRIFTRGRYSLIVSDLLHCL